MIAKAAAGVVLGFIVAAMVLVGVSFAGFAIFTALSRPVGVPGAAALTALILLIGPLLFAFVASIRQPRRTNLLSEAALLNLLSGVTKDRPLLAMAGAGLLGAAAMFLRKRR
jgi:hypothetical protein